MFTRLLACIIGAASTAILGGCLLNCVVEGTLISTPQGLREVESLRVGDAMWTTSFDGTQVEGTITGVHKGSADQFIAIRFTDGRELRCTPQHLISTPHGWVRAGSLANSEAVVTAQGEAIASIERTKGKRTNVFDLSIQPNENFIANGVLVHNKSIARPLMAAEVADVYIGVAWSSSYRLVLKPDGTGEASRGTFRFSSRGRYDYSQAEFVVETLTLTSWQVADRSITVNLADPGDGRKFQLKGDVSGLSLYLQVVEADGRRWGEKERFDREHLLQKQLSGFESAMRD